MAIGGEGMPDHVRAVLQRMRAEVEKNCDYVGPNFAAEARKIHRGESDRRSIYGETTPDQAEIAERRGHRVLAHPMGAAGRRLRSSAIRGHHALVAIIR